MINRWSLTIVAFCFLFSCGKVPPTEDEQEETETSTVLRPWKLICLGGSATVGIGVDPQDAYPAKLESLLQEEGPVKVVNAGIRAETLAGAEARIAWILQQRLDAFLIAPDGGPVDKQLSTEQRLKLWQQLLTTLRNAYPTIPVFIVPLYTVGEGDHSRIWDQLPRDFNVQLLQPDQQEIEALPVVEQHTMLASWLSEYLREYVRAYYQQKAE